MSNQEYRWFIEPDDDFTNGVIAAALSQLGEGGDENLAIALEADDGTTHNVWEVPDHAFVGYLARSRLPLKFTVFNCRGQGKFREWKFEKPQCKKRVSAGKTK